MLRSLLVALSFSTVGFAANQVHIVGTGGFSTLQSAIDAASDGDTLLLKTGVFTTGTIVDKGLTIVTDDPADIGIHRIRELKIQNLAAQKTVVVRGVEFTEFGWSPTPRIDITGCSGTVLIEDCQANRSVPAAVRVTNSAAVFLARCVVEGRSGQAMVGTAALPALIATNSQVFAYDSVIEGGAGAHDVGNPDQLYPGLATDGGTGAEITGGALFASGTIVSGGDGGDILNGLGYSGFGPFYAGDGGAALKLSGGAISRRLQSPLIPGAAGVTLKPPPFYSGSAGVAVIDEGGSQFVISEFARKLELVTPVREGGSQSVSLSGQPFEPAWLLFSLGTQGGYISGLKGALLPALPVTLVALGALDFQGKLDFDVALPADVLPPGVDAVTIQLQGMFAGANSPILLSSPSATVLLDDVF
jgi:hypothetical protein